MIDSPPINTIRNMDKQKKIYDSIRNISKVLLLLIFCHIMIESVSAQESQMVGTWIYHYPGYYVDGEEICPKQDRYLKIYEKDSNWFVSIKRGKDGEFWGYSEATHVTLNSDGSLSFNEFYDNKVKHDNGTTSHCYTKYRVWIVGRTLHVKPLSVFFWYDHNGNLFSQSEQEERPDAICVYHNEKENW